jgi:hypothetical protein
VNLYSIFPTAVAKFELGREYTAEESAFVDSQETHKNQGNTTSNDRYVLRHDTMASLKEFVEASVGRVPALHLRAEERGRPTHHAVVAELLQAR